jgi:hypothetical protein
MKLWEAHVFKKHNTSRLKTFPLKKKNDLRSFWVGLVVRAITLQPPFPSLGLGKYLE